jgi:tetratricopeptide (TPR) repeat protein
MGQVATSSSDQFSFCVALYEALYDERPFGGETLASLAMEVTSGRVRDAPASSGVPQHIRRALLRGLATEAKDRHPTIEALREALALDPATKRRQVFFGVGAILLLGGVVALSRASAGRGGDDICASASTEFAGSWNEDRAAQLNDALVLEGVPFTQRSATKSSELLSGYAKEWTAARVDACEATHLRHAQSMDMFDRRVSCLTSRRESFDALVSVLLDADVDVTTEAVQAVQALPPLARCSDSAALLARIAPPGGAEVAAAVKSARRQLARVAALEDAGRYKEASAQAQNLREQAESIDYRPLQAEYAQRVGSIERNLGHRADAAAAYERSHWAATASGDRERAAQSAAALSALRADPVKHADTGPLWAELARASAESMGSPPKLWAEVLNEQGELERSRGKFERAAELHGEALSVLEGAREARIESTLRSQASALNELARYDEAQAAIERAIVLLSAQLGGGHPKVADAKGTLALILHRRGDYDKALEVQNATVDSLRASLGPEHVETGRALINLGTMLQAKGKIDEAQAAYEGAKVAFESGDGEHAHEVALAYDGMGVLDYMRGDLEGAVTKFEASIKITQEELGPKDPSLTNTLSNYAAILSVLERHEQALPVADQVIEIERELRGPSHPQVAFALEQRAAIARRLERWEEARRDFERAIDIYDAVHGREHSSSGTAWAGLSNLALQAGDETRAAELLETALRCFGDDEEFRNLRGQSRFGLAKLLWKQRAQRERALALAREGREDMVAFGERGAQIVVEIDDWLKGR